MPLVVGHYAVRPGHIVYINDTSLFLGTSDSDVVVEDVKDQRNLDISLRFYLNPVDALFVIPNADHSNDLEAFVTGFTSSFGGDLSVKPQFEQKPVRFSNADGLPIYRDQDNSLGCDHYKRSYQEGVILIQRGDCTFLQKLMMAKSAGAAGIIVISQGDTGINPTANQVELDAAGDISDVAIVVLTREGGQLVEEMMDLAEKRGMGQLMVAVDPERRTAFTETQDEPQKEGSENKNTSSRILYLNGHGLMNTRLLV